ncbi:hypothetical protein RJ640_021259, partial [Escallonia rubra]
SSGCLGCDTKPKLITSVNEPLKGQKLQTRTLSKPSISEDFWTTSTCDMDNSAAQSRGSISSISTSNQAIDAHGTGSGNIPSEFVNHGKLLLLHRNQVTLFGNDMAAGLLLWNQSRQHWIGNKRSENRAQQLREPKLSWNATYDSLLGSNKPFPKPIPLSEMVDFLVDIWEQEGMYD